MKIAILDDDVEFSKSFKDLVNPYLKNILSNAQIQIINTNFYKVISDNKFDILFIDIDLKETTGIKLAKLLKKIDINTIIIFVSSRNELVFNALTVQPFQFIRKSNLVEDLQITLKLIKNHFQKYSKLITIDLYGRKTSIKISDIVYIESIGHEISIITEDDSYTYRSSLKEISKLIDSKDFCRIQKSIIINFNFVKEIIKNDIFLKNGNIFTISRHYKKDVMQNYKEYLLR